MEDPRQNHRFINLHEEDFEVLLDRAAERGAKRALKDVGLEEPDAAQDLRELRHLLSALRLARTTQRSRPVFVSSHPPCCSPS